MNRTAQALLVSPDADITKNLGQILRETGFAVSHAPSVQDPGSAFAEDANDVIVLDVGTPDDETVESTRRVCSENPRIPVIAIADHGDGEAGARLIDAGVCEFTSKPVSATSIERALLRALRARVEFLWTELDLEAASGDVTETSGDDRTGAQRVWHYLGNIALFLAAPFIALSYSLALPFVGFYVFVRRFFMAGREGNPDS
ncbi:MAG: response regulator [Xanthomonadales bacterium]|nr:response regulator [Xanthomonadales bacterium]